MRRSTRSYARAAFDLTCFSSPNKFKEVLKENKLTKYKKINKGRYNVFSRKGKDVEIRTGNNPITGEFSGGDKEKPREKGYASYIGIEGEPSKVKKIFGAIKTKTSDIKDEDPYNNPYIW